MFVAISIERELLGLCILYISKLYTLSLDGNQTSKIIFSKIRDSTSKLVFKEEDRPSQKRR
jgi:hypothetical protein